MNKRRHCPLIQLYLVSSQQNAIGNFEIFQPPPCAKNLKFDMQLVFMPEI